MGVREGVVGGVNSTVGWLEGAWNDIVAALTEAARVVVAKITYAAKVAFEGMKTGLNFMANIIDLVLNKLLDLLGLPFNLVVGVMTLIAAIMAIAIGLSIAKAIKRKVRDVEVSAILESAKAAAPAV
jgi:TRAP-type C4-dicarboxylate transport system permease small subunit